MKLMFFIVIVLFHFSCDKTDFEESVISRFPQIPNKEILPPEVVVIHDVFEAKEMVIIGDVNDLFIVSFERELNGELLIFSPISGELPVIMEDGEGNKWDIFGYAVSGQKKGQRLIPTQSLMGYWFSIATFYPGTEIYPDNGKGEFDGEVITGSDGWLIPEKEIRSGGVGKDGIPAISNPKFTIASNVDYLADKDLVVGFSNGYDLKSYPHAVLDWHEIINDGVKDFTYSIIYCPLTGTATAWNRKIEGNLTSFGVSGFLYNSNIIPYDRATGSNWSQLFDVSVNGKRKGMKPENFMILETKWETWKKMYPGSSVVNFQTDYIRDYGNYPYGSAYRTEGNLIFPIKYKDSRIHRKERVHAVIINGRARVYRFENFIGE